MAKKRTLDNDVVFSYTELKSAKNARLFEVKSNFSGAVFYHVVEKGFNYPESWPQTIFNLEEAIKKLNL